VQAALRRHVSAIEGGFHQAASIRKDVANPHKPVTRSPGDITLERRGVEKPSGMDKCPPRDHWQNWICAEASSHHSDLGSRRRAPLAAFPKRIDVHCSVRQAKAFRVPIDYRLALRGNPCDSVIAAPLCATTVLLSRPKAAFPPRFNNQAIKKGNLSYLAVVNLVREIQGQR